MTKRHKVFVSYHHENDEKYRNRFENLRIGQGNIMDSKSVEGGDINSFQSDVRINQIIREDYLSDSTVTVVLIGEETFRRAYVDWEIEASIRHTDFNRRSGLLGILLPGRSDFHTKYYDEDTIPARLAKNVDCGFAEIHNWSKNPDLMKELIHTAFEVSKVTNPINNQSISPIYHSISQPIYQFGSSLSQSIYNRSGRNYGH